MEKVLIVITVPQSHVEAVLNAIADAGGGEIGEYTDCAFTSIGQGRFKPSDAASPHVGEQGEINSVEEWRVETFCKRERAKVVVSAIRASHPYEEPVIYVIPLLDESAL